MAQTTKCIQDVVKKVTALRRDEKHKTLRIAIRGGRHSYIGASTASKGVVVDVSRFNYVQQHNDRGLMTVGAGITLGELYHQLWRSLPNRLHYPGGTCPTVGLSGLTLGGGQGVTGRKYGLSTDQVVEVWMVNSTGELVIINETSHEDLFWALRGGGNGNFGIVYQFTLKRYEIPQVNTDIVIYFYNSSDWHKIISEWQKFIMDPFFENYHDVWSQLSVSPTGLRISFHVSGADTLRNIEDLTNVPGTTPSGYYANTSYIKCSYTPDNYSGSIAFWAGCTTAGQCGTTEDLEQCLRLPSDCDGTPFRMNSGYQSESLSDDGIQTVIDYMLQVENITGCQSAAILLDTMGGKINEPQTNSTAFPHRKERFNYQFLSYFVNPCNESAMIAWLDAFHNNMSKYMSPGAYRNYANLDLTSHNKRYFRDNLPRLIDIKGKYDPQNLFSYSQSIPSFKIIPPQSKGIIPQALFGLTLFIGILVMMYT